MSRLAFKSEMKKDRISTADVVAAIGRWGVEPVRRGFVDAIAYDREIFGKNPKSQYETICAIALSIKYAE